MTVALVEIDSATNASTITLEESSQSATLTVETGIPGTTDGLPFSGGTLTGQVRVIPTEDLSASTSAGGAVNIFNSASAGAGLVVYSTNDDPTGHLIVARVNHASFDQAAFYAEYVGTSHSLSVNHQGTGLNSSAANLVSANTQHSALMVTGVETARGTVKVTHTGTGTDASAAAISLQLAGTGTAAQGIYIYSDDGTTGDLIEANNAGSLQFKVASDGDVELVGDLILRSPDGSRFALRVSNGGVLSVNAL